jgi:hypothetical protein
MYHMATTPTADLGASFKSRGTTLLGGFRGSTVS